MSDTSSAIGSGAIAAIMSPPVTALTLVIARLMGLSLGALDDFPTAMIGLWGFVYAIMLAAPVAFVLGAVVGVVVAAAMLNDAT